MAELPTPRQRIEAALRLGRALRLVWRAAPGWTLANLALVLVQGTLPLAALYVMKRILDAVSAAVGAPGRPELIQAVWLWILVAGGVALVTVLTRLVGEYVTEAQSLQVTDSVAETLHAQSIAVDLAYYEDPAYYDTLHRAQGEAPYRPARIVSGLVQIAQNGLALAGIAAWLVSFNWALAAALFLAVLPGAFARLVYSRRLYGLQQAQTEQERRSWYYHTILTEALHAKELRIFNLGALFQGRYRDVRHALRSGTLALARHRIATELLTQAAGDSCALRIAGVDRLADDSRHRDAGRSGRLLSGVSDRAHAAADRPARARGTVRRQPVPHEPLPVPRSASRHRGAAPANARAAAHHTGHRVSGRRLPVPGPHRGHARGHRSRAWPGRGRRARRRERLRQEHDCQAALPLVRPGARRHHRGRHQPSRHRPRRLEARDQRRVPGLRALRHDRRREHLAGRHRQARRPGMASPAPASARAQTRS